jgi:hypothetical protein
MRIAPRHRREPREADQTVTDLNDQVSRTGLDDSQTDLGERTSHDVPQKGVRASASLPDTDPAAVADSRSAHLSLNPWATRPLDLELPWSSTVTDLASNRLVQHPALRSVAAVLGLDSQEEPA